MLDTFVQQRIRELIAMTRPDSGAAMNLRVAWAKLGMVLGDDRWSKETYGELMAVNTAFETYIGKTELAKAGSGSPPIEREFEVLLDQVRALERLLPASERGEAS